MKTTRTYEYDEDKNTKLIAERGISFEDIIEAIETGLIAKAANVKRPPQKIAFVNIDNYVWEVRFLEEGDVWVLKTAMKSRKATKRFLKE